jgi:Ribbon-helix-helix domain
MAKKTLGKTEDRIRYALWLDQKELERLREYQREVGVPVSESIRRAISDYLDRLKTAKK